jgi:flagellar biosynthesis protein FliP
MRNKSLHLTGGAGAALAGELRRIGLLAAQRACTMFSVLVTALPIQNTNMQQYIISLALLIAAPVALPTSHANAQSQAEMNRQAHEGTTRTL